jgi:hypothetical protein
MPDAGLLDALRLAIEQFLVYMGADGVQTSEGIDRSVRQVITDLVRL